MKFYPFIVPHDFFDFVHDFIRKLMFCSVYFITKTNIDVCLQKMPSCLSNISFNIITCSIVCLCATKRKVTSLKFACVLNSTYHEMIRLQ